LAFAEVKLYSNNQKIEVNTTDIYGNVCFSREGDRIKLLGEEFVLSKQKFYYFDIIINLSSKNKIFTIQFGGQKMNLTIERNSDGKKIVGVVDNYVDLPKTNEFYTITVDFPP